MGDAARPAHPGAHRARLIGHECKCALPGMRRVRAQNGSEPCAHKRIIARSQAEPSSSTCRASIVAARWQLQTEPTDDLNQLGSHARGFTSSSMLLTRSGSTPPMAASSLTVCAAHMTHTHA